MTPIIYYLMTEEPPSNEVEIKKIWKFATKYTVMSIKLYRMEDPSTC